MFCAGTPVTREHLWPDWLRRETQIREPFERRIEQETDGVETRDDAFMEPPFNGGGQGRVRRVQQRLDV